MRTGPFGAGRQPRHSDAIMTIPLNARLEFCARYHHVKKWPTAAMARQLNINPVTVMRVLAQAGLPPIGLNAT